MREKVIENYKKGYNCAQSILMEYSEKYGIEREKILQMSIGLGSGMYCKETCGAVSAGIMIIGMKYGNSKPKDIESIKSIVKKVKEFEKEFRDENGSLNCFELKNNKKDCKELIKKSVDILEKMEV